MSSEKHGEHGERYRNHIKPLIKEMEKSAFSSKDISERDDIPYSSHQVGRTLSYFLDHDPDLDRTEISPSIWTYGEVEEVRHEDDSSLDSFLDTILDRLNNGRSMSRDELRGRVFNYLEDEKGVEQIGRKAERFGEISNYFVDNFNVEYVMEEGVYRPESV